MVAGSGWPERIRSIAHPLVSGTPPGASLGRPPLKRASAGSPSPSGFAECAGPGIPRTPMNSNPSTPQAAHPVEMLLLACWPAGLLACWLSAEALAVLLVMAAAVMLTLAGWRPAAAPMPPPSRKPAPACATTARATCTPRNRAPEPS